MWCRSAVTFPSFSVLLLVVCDPALGTRFPGSEPGACFAVPHSPRSPPFAPPTPLPVVQLCSSVSQLLWRSLTSHVGSSSAMAPRLPDADPIASLRLAGRVPSRFPCNELPHMPGSSTTPGPPGARAYAPVCIAFRLRNGVSTRNMNLCGAQWLAYVCSSADASLPPSQATAHGSSMWIATPSSYGTCTHYLLPVSRRTAKDSGPPKSPPPRGSSLKLRGSRRGRALRRFGLQPDSQTVQSKRNSHLAVFITWYHLAFLFLRLNSLFASATACQNTSV